MKNKFLIPLIISFCLFLAGFGMGFSKDDLVTEIGLWIRFVGTLSLAIVAILIYVNSRKVKKQGKNNSQSENSDKEELNINKEDKND